MRNHIDTFQCPPVSAGLAEVVLGLPSFVDTTVMPDAARDTVLSVISIEREHERDDATAAALRAGHAVVATVAWQERWYENWQLTPARRQHLARRHPSPIAMAARSAMRAFNARRMSDGAPPLGSDTLDISDLRQRYPDLSQSDLVRNLAPAGYVSSKYTHIGRPIVADVVDYLHTYPPLPLQRPGETSYSGILSHWNLGLYSPVAEWAIDQTGVDPLPRAVHRAASIVDCFDDESTARLHECIRQTGPPTEDEEDLAMLRSVWGRRKSDHERHERLLDAAVYLTHTPIRYRRGRILQSCILQSDLASVRRVYRILQSLEDQDPASVADFRMGTIDSEM